MSSTSIQTFMTWVDRYLNFERQPQKNMFWLDTMRFLCEKLGHPESSCPCIHVAGSKGKGSVSTMIASILEADGLRVGLYQSPHIVDFRERIHTAHDFFPDEIYAQAAEELMSAVESIPAESFPGGRPLTWFELVTVFAMLCFRAAKVDYAVYEVGLGGRLDATNVIHPQCCCIAPIELEHTEYLGDTLEKIAAEKGGIIKQGVPVILSPQQHNVRAVLEMIAGEKNAPVYAAEDCIDLTVGEYHLYKEASPAEGFYNHAGMDIMLHADCLKRPVRTTLRLPGYFQGQNAAVAVLAVKTVLPDMAEESIELGLSQAMLSGRFEIVSPVPGYDSLPELILDGAHTKNSVQFTMDTFRHLYGQQPAHLLFACAADKDAEDIACSLAGHFTKVTLTRPGEAKAADMNRLRKSFTAAGIIFTSDEDYAAAIKSALTAAAQAHVPLLVTGSFYLVAEVKKILTPQTRAQRAL